MIVSVVFAEEADAAGLVKRAISTVGTWRVSDLPSVTVFNNQSNTYSGSNTQSFGTNAITFGSDPADTGNLRLSNTGIIGWESDVAGTDITLSVDASEDIIFGTGATNINFNSNPLANSILADSLDANSQIISSLGTPSATTDAQRVDKLGLQNVVTSTCANGAPLEYQTSNSTWICGVDDVGGNSISQGNSDVTVTDAGTGQVDVTVDGANQLSVTSSVADFQSNEIREYVRNVETFTSADSLDATNDIVILNPSTTAFTITLPAVSGLSGKTYDIFYKATTGTVVTIDGNGAETINDVANIKLEHYLSHVKLWTDGSEWFADYDSAGFGRENHYVMFDDFSAGAITEVSGEAGDSNWAVLIDGTTADDLTFVDGALDRVGVITIGSGSTSGNDWALLLGASATLTFMDFDQPNWSMTTNVAVPTITTLTTRIGIAETITGASWEGADNAFFKFDPAVSANWQCVTFASAAETTTTGVAVNAGQFYKLKVLKDGGTIRFLIDDVNVCNHSTQVPNALASPAMQVQTNTGASRTIQIDYFRLSMVLAR